MSNVNHEIIRECYLEILMREPDKEGFDYFLDLMNRKMVNKSQIKEIMKNSKEYKSKQIKFERGNLDLNSWMKRDWNMRAKMDQIYYFGLESHDEKTYWEKGKEHALYIKEVLFKGKNTHKMKALEIGPGMGRILKPLSNFFEEVYGVDVSPNVVKLCRENTRNISNCKVYENSGSDLSMFNENFFDLCYAYLVFQHIPEKTIIKKYFKEISRVLKGGGLFWFTAYGDVELARTSHNTQIGVQFNPLEIHDMSKRTNFEILEEKGKKSGLYTITLKCNKQA